MADTDIKQVGVLGRVVIPAELRKQLNLDTGAKIKISVKGDTLVITPMDGKECIICEKEAKFPIEVHGKTICVDCLKRIGEVSLKEATGEQGE